jgi:ABC-type multidrug transport system ATPase subunit
VCHLRRDSREVAADMARFFGRFPILYDRRTQMAGTLSGGEQQMLAIVRALMSRPKLVMFDEPSLGLAPNIVDRVFDVIKGIQAQGATIMMVEQNAFAALELSDRSYVMEQGRLTLTGTGKALLENPQVKAAYLGVLNSRRISLGGKTVPPTGGVAFSSWAWAKTWVAMSAKAGDTGIVGERVRMAQTPWVRFPGASAS